MRCSIEPSITNVLEDRSVANNRKTIARITGKKFFYTRDYRQLLNAS